MWSSLVLIALLASAQGRAVNISNTWVLPEEGFPVFYRYFRDRISWYEADAVCQFHHANLVTVDTTAQYDAVRAYLKELDISSAVWVGLIRSNPDGDFTWTDYRGLSGDGYWSSAPDTRSAPLCAAADPVADYRWEARPCGGPTVASFICELPVPQWALGSEGCMVRELPALTILYLPESAAVQLNADCGLAGVKRVQCTGNVKREGLLKDLSCADEDEITSTGTPTLTSTNWPATTGSADPDTNSEVTTEENITTEHEVDINQQILITATSIPQYLKSKAQYKSQTKFTDMGNFNTVIFRKDINLNSNDDHNTHSNFIPKLVDENNVLRNDQLQKLEDERNMQHRMIHEEIARVGNLNNIFSQPADHFIPPLVMAKSRMSDDMTVLSLAEKHAQQLAEKHLNKQKHADNVYVDTTNNKLISDNTHIDMSLIKPVKPNIIKDKLGNLKSHVPKKYINDKYNESKGKSYKWETKTTETEAVKATAPTKTMDDENRTTPTKNRTYYHDKIDEDFAMDLKVMLKDTPSHREDQTIQANYTSDVAKLDHMKTLTINNGTINDTHADQVIKPLDSQTENENVTMEHQVIKITVISNADPTVNTSVFEITTKMPIFRDDADNFHTFSTTVSSKTQTTVGKTTSENTSEISKVSSQSELPNVSVTFPVTTTTPQPIIENITSIEAHTTTEEKPIPELTTVMPVFENKSEISKLPSTMSSTTFSNISDEIDKGVTDAIDEIANDITSTYNHTGSASFEPPASSEKNDFNITEIHDFMEKNMTDSEEIIDADSPLLSGAYEPIHRPPRTRRPQQQNRKFNPFRILG